MPTTQSADLLEQALAQVDRRLFVPEKFREQVQYADLPVALSAKITVPSRAMTHLVVGLLGLKPEDRCLEIGTGSGYQCAVLARMCAEVVTVDITVVPDTVLDLLPANVYVHDEWDGRLAIPSEGHFDAILVTCAARQVEPAWVEMLAEGGRLVVPIGPRTGQAITKFVKLDGKLEDMGPYAYAKFVPMDR